MSTPIPDYDKQQSGGGFYYYKLGHDAYDETAARQLDDYNPIVQLNKLLDCAGTPDIAYRIEDDGSRVAYDANNTWEKIDHALPDFINRYCGKGFESIVKKEAEGSILLN